MITIHKQKSVVTAETNFHENDHARVKSPNRPADISRARDTDTMANENVSKTKKNRSSTLAQRMRSDASWTIQIEGANTNKTVFNQTDIRNLRKKVCSKGQPLVLLHSGLNTSGETAFTLGSMLFEKYQDGLMAQEELLAFHFVIFSEEASESLGLGPALSTLVGAHEFDIFLVDALLGMNAYSRQEANEIFSRQYVVAAMLCEGLLGSRDIELSDRLVQRVPTHHRQRALDEAFFFCFGVKGAAIANHLLSWGASPNAQNEDGFSILGTAISLADRPMIEILLSRGADPYFDTLAEISAVRRIRNPDSMALAPLFEKYLKPI